LSVPRFRARTDGASRGNPGPAAIGVSIENEAGEEVATASEAIGVATNNVAEYRALARAVELLTGLGARRVEFLLDSELIVRQMNGQYRVRDPKMQRLFQEVRRGLGRFTEATFRHVPRTENTRADALANRALDRAEKRA
jgi:ribonuclease HI